MIFLNAIITRNFYINTRIYPFTFMIGRLIGSLGAVFFPLIIYKYIFSENLSNDFIAVTGTSDYFIYIITGVSIYTFGVATLMNTGRAFITEIREGTIDVFIMSSTPRILYFIGCMIEQIWRSFIEFIIIIIIGLIFSLNFQSFITIDMFFMFILLLFSFFSMSIFISTIMIKTRDTYITQNTIFHVILLICGITFPIEFLPEILQKISQLIPITHCIEIFRNLIINSIPLIQQMDSILKLIILSSIYIVVGYVWYLRVEKKIIEELFT